MHYYLQIGTEFLLATARTQSSNGLAERYVAVVEEILRTRVNYLQQPPPPLLSPCTIWAVQLYRSI